MKANIKTPPLIRAKVVSLLRITVISIVVGLLLIQTSNPQEIIDPPNVRLEFRCPTHVLAPGQPMPLLANVIGAKEILGEEGAKLIAYRWEVSGAKIIAGQGTPQVTVEASELPSNSVASIMVKVILAGGPPELAKERTCALKIDPSCPAPVSFDQYHESSLKDERLHLDRLGKYLTSEGATSTAFIVAYAGWKHCFREAELRADRAKRYLVDKYKVNANRVITVDGGFRDHLTTDIFIAPQANCGPFPTPQVIRSSGFTGSCGDKYKD